MGLDLLPIPNLEEGILGYLNINFLRLSQLLNQFNPDSFWHTIGASAEPAFAGTWVNFDATYEQAGFRKDLSGFVHLRGRIKSGTLNTTAFTLPVGYRPGYKREVGTISNGAIGRLEINTDGTVVPVAGSNVSFSISVPSFLAEA